MNKNLFRPIMSHHIRKVRKRGKKLWLLKHTVYFLFLFMCWHITAQSDFQDDVAYRVAPVAVEKGLLTFKYTQYGL